MFVYNYFGTLPIAGADLKRFRQEACRMTVDQFAGRAGTTRRNIARLERLNRPLTADELRSTMSKPVPFDAGIHKITLHIGPETH